MEEKTAVYTPQKTWFFRRGDGEIFASYQSEAYELIYGRSTWMRKDFTLIGFSDGTTYGRIIASAKEAAQEARAKVKAAQDKLQKYLDGKEKLMFEQFKDENDPMVVRAQSFIEKAEEELRAATSTLKDSTKNIAKAAFDAELEVAKKNMELGKVEYPKDAKLIMGSSVSDEEKNLIMSRLPR